MKIDTTGRIPPSHFLNGFSSAIWDNTISSVLDCIENNWDGIWTEIMENIRDNLGGVSPR